MRAIAFGLALWLLGAPAANALSLAILEDDTMPKPGHVREQLVASYTPWDLWTIGGTTWTSRQGYAFTSVVNQLEVGFMPDASVGVIAPYGFYRGFDASLPESSASGIGDVAVLLSKRVWSTDALGLRLRLNATLPTGNSTSKLGSGVPQVSLDAFLRCDLGVNALSYLAFADYTYGMRHFTEDAASVLTTQWMGHQAAISQGIRWSPSDSLSVTGLVVMDYFSPAETNRQNVSESGAFTLTLAPSAQFKLGAGVSLIGMVDVPVVRTGYQDSDQYSVLLGAQLEL